ncbi:MAG: substrate-binding domain-containing protein, partial [Verrucomicrobiota bacterium]
RMAIGAMRFLHTEGLRIPADVSVMGVDDIPQAQFTTPGLTTIRHELYQLGQACCERLLALFREKIATCREVLPVRLIVRESTGPAKKG